MGYTLGQAAKACGKSKMTIARAIQAGRISASRTDTGSYAIDPSELHRVYPLEGNGASQMGRDATAEVSTVTAERDLYRALAEERAETIADLRKRLDSLTALLTHRQAGSVPSVPRPEASFNSRAPWWRRWFR
jgi:hypothetical protein